MSKIITRIILLLSLLVCGAPVWAQTTVTVPAQIDVDFGELSLRNATGELNFGVDRYPGDVNVRPAANVLFLLTDTRLPQGSSYHVTVQATTDFIDGANSFSATNLVVNQAAVTVTANAGNTNPEPAVPLVPNLEIRSAARRVLEANQGTTPTTGFGEWVVQVDSSVQNNWLLTIPSGTPNGFYTATVTFTVVPGL